MFNMIRKITLQNIIMMLASHGWLPISDKYYLKLRYKYITGRELNIKNPQTFNEKLQWLKLYDRRPEYTNMVDKYEVKKYVASIIGKEYIIPTLGVWENFDQINFKELPNQFVIKCTHDSGGLSICYDKSKFNFKQAKEKIAKALCRNYFYQSREWPYKNVRPRVIVEKFMQDNNNFKESSNLKPGLTDYKFYCFNGEPKYLYISQGLDYHPTARISFLNLDWTFAPFGRSDYKPFENIPQKPSQLDKMIEIAKKLSRGIPFVRVDLYQVDQEVFFSELTFSPCGGMMPFYPSEYDKILGELINIDSVKKCEI